MPEDVPVKCSCGKVGGVIRSLSPGSSNHVRCACKGCQSYAHYLGRAHDMLDSEGYSNIFQINPADFEIHEGLEHLACVRITPKGPLRWHAACCKTPLGNTFPKGGVPFIGVLPICSGHKGASDEVVKMIGPSRANVNGRNKASLGEKVKTLRMLPRFVCKLIAWRIKGGKSWKPFFKEDTMEPIREPILVTKEERKALYAKVV